MTFRPGSTERKKRYVPGSKFLSPLAEAAHLLAAQAAGTCVGWNKERDGRALCQKRAIRNSPYCEIHHRWDFRLKRDVWDVERYEGKRRLFREAAPAIPDPLPLIEQDEDTPGEPCCVPSREVPEIAVAKVNRMADEWIRAVAARLRATETAASVTRA